MTEDRNRYLRSLIRIDGVGLEIGPSYNQLLPKSSGYRVETIDYIDQAGLRAKYASDRSIDPAVIEEVDFVLDGTKTLAAAVNRQNYYDYIVASHVIEHVPDLLRFLRSCETLLKPDGVLLLAVPDKRHCFDVFQPLTSTGHILQAYLDRRTRPAPGAVFDDFAYNAVRDGRIGWPIGGNGALSFFSNLREASAVFERLQSECTYVDVHIWRFVPSSFRLIMRDLNEIGQIGLREKDFRDSVGNEFYLTLSCAAPGCPVDRLTLARNALAEHAQIPC
jgi:SAM-dependent methyltransferase